MRPFGSSPVDAPLVDLIYEAAFDPDRWSEVLIGLSRLTGSESGAVLAYRGIMPVGGRATGLTQEVNAVAMGGTPDSTQLRMAHCFANPIFGFVDAADYFPVETHDIVDDKRIELGIGEEIGTIVQLAADELAIFVLHRRTSDGPFRPTHIDLVNRYYAHLCRSALVAARLGLERARAAAATLNALGVPAAVLSRSGCVRASNASLEDVADILKPTAFGGMAIADPAANKLFQGAVEQSAGAHDGVVRSIPVPARDGGDPLVVHLVPLRRSAQDLFSGCDVLVAATRVNAARPSPAPAVLMALFDLTPAEVRLAGSLAKGLTLKTAASANGVQFSTARSYLDAIFRKTGVNRQSELVSLLNSTQPPG